MDYAYVPFCRLFTRIRALLKLDYITNSPSHWSYLETQQTIGDNIAKDFLGEATAMPTVVNDDDDDDNTRWTPVLAEAGQASHGSATPVFKIFLQAAPAPVATVVTLVSSSHHQPQCESRQTSRCVMMCIIFPRKRRQHRSIRLDTTWGIHLHFWCVPHVIVCYCWLKWRKSKGLYTFLNDEPERLVHCVMQSNTPCRFIEYVGSLYPWMAQLLPTAALPPLLSLSVWQQIYKALLQ
jgi:hypothetical protein